MSLRPCSQEVDNCYLGGNDDVGGDGDSHQNSEILASLPIGSAPGFLQIPHCSASTRR